MNYTRTRLRQLSRTLDSFIRGTEDFLRAKAVLPFVYYILFFRAFVQLEGLDQLSSTAQFIPRFPLFWAHGLSASAVGQFVFTAWAFGALIACLFPYARLARLAAFLGFLEYHAYMSSFGGPIHQWDHWLWGLFLLVFLPSLKNEDENSRKVFSLVFWSAQAFLLLTYSMAGADKLVQGVLQFLAGEANAFSPDAGALHIATELLAMGETSLLGPLLVRHPLLSWLPFLGVLYIQFFALLAAFRPKLHRLWGIGLILFHLGTLFTMRAVFIDPSGLLLVLLVSSPFAPHAASVREICTELPLMKTARRLEEWAKLKLALHTRA